MLKVSQTKLKYTPGLYQKLVEMENEDLQDDITRDKIDERSML
jgi:hypothetical protein